ncbi:MAG: energy-coupling factor transporter ATPase [Firmicutes bacterium]|nr:energy-coupling factor transporter ATPase [Bacillota bacterium]
MSKETVIQLKDISFSYYTENADGTLNTDTDVTMKHSEKRFALDGVTLDIERGSFVAVVGSNGSGKSTLAKHLNALLLPTSGEVLVCGMSTADPDNTWEIRRRCGMVFQNPDNQLVSSVVEDDVAFGPENLGVEPSEIRSRVDNALNAVGMYEFRKKGPHLLSGGQKQRIAIAGVLAMQPECIVFDEPTAMLDPSGRAGILKIIRGLHEQGKTVILITHFMEEAAQAERIIVMDQGKPILDETPAKLFAHAEQLSALNLQMPFGASMAAKLSARGVDLPEGIITSERLAECLCG